MTIQDLEYIQHLERELKAVKRERDAAISDMKRAQGCICNICKNHYRPDSDVRRYECKILGKFSEIFDDDDGGALLCGKYEWRGVCSENTEVQMRTDIKPNEPEWDGHTPEQAIEHIGKLEPSLRLPMLHGDTLPTTREQALERLGLKSTDEVLKESADND